MLPRKYVLPLVVLLIVIVLLPITYLAVKKQQELRGRAAMIKTPETVDTFSKDGRPEYVAGEVLVKFKVQSEKFKVRPERTRAGINVDKGPVDINDLDTTDMETGILANFLKQQGVLKLEKVFKGSGDPKEDVAKFKARFPERASQVKPEAEKIDLSRTYKLSFDKKVDIKAKIQQLLGVPLVENATPNYFRYTSIIPNDTFFSQQWSLNQASNHDINAPEAWDIITGSSDVVVAVVDSGIYLTHPDLQNRLFINEKEVPNNGIDDDTNGFVDDYQGWDTTICAVWNLDTGYCDRLKDESNNANDDLGHGTHVAGIIGAQADNGQGIAGIDWQAKLLPVKSLNFQGAASCSEVNNGIYYAAQFANVINLSLGAPAGVPPCEGEEDAINTAYNLGVTIIAAAGNDGESSPTYPAAHTNAIAVVATDQNDNRASFSNYGDWVDISAPGVAIFSTTLPGANLGGCLDDDNDGYMSCSGTSMATPHVSGVAALILSQNPLMNMNELKRKLFFGVDDKGDSGWDREFGFGRINAEKAVNPAILANGAVISVPSENKVISNRQIQITGYSFADNFSSFKVEIGIGETPDSWQTTGLTLVNDGSREVFGGKLADFNPQDLPHGSLVLRLVVFDQAGQVAVAERRIKYLPQRIIYVDDDNISSIEDGTIEHPFNTIQEGLDDANPLDTVKVLAGSYEENIHIDKSSVYLSGENPFTTIISGNGERYSMGIRSNVYPETHTDFLIENFTIRNFERGIIISGPAQDGILQNNIIKDIAIHDDPAGIGDGYGIQLDFFNRNMRIIGNFIAGGVHGILQNGPGNSNNSFEFNYTTDAIYAGIHAVWPADQLIFKDNVTVKNRRFGIVPFSCFPNLTIINNHMERNTTAGLLALFCPEDTNIVIYENNFVDNEQYQVFLRSGLQNIIWTSQGKGNYWSNYDESDEGAFDNNNDGIADSPYRIDETNQDDFPLMKENGWLRSDFVLRPQKTIAGAKITILGENLGSFHEANRVILNYNRVHETYLDIESWNDGRIVARIPEQIFPGRYYVYLLINGQNDNLPIFTGLVLTIFHSVEFISQDKLIFFPGWNRVGLPAELAEGFSGKSLLEELGRVCGNVKFEAIGAVENEKWSEYVSQFGGEDFQIVVNKDYWLKTGGYCLYQ